MGDRLVSLIAVRPQASFTYSESVPSTIMGNEWCLEVAMSKIKNVILISSNYINSQA